MTRWWDAAGAKVIEPVVVDDEWGESYGPRIVRKRDTTGHMSELSLLVADGTSYHVFACECGKRDLWINHQQHLDEVAPMVEVYE